MKTTKIAQIGLIILIPLFILLLSYQITLTNDTFFSSEIAQNGAYAKLGQEWSENANKQVLGYLNNDLELGDDIFSQQEITHLKDVKTLMGVAKITLLLIGILILMGVWILLQKQRMLYTALFIGGLSTLLLMAFGVIILLTFNTSFILFHKILFTNNLWILPADSVLIQLYPQQFFINFVKRTLIISTIFAIILIIIGKFKK